MIVVKIAEQEVANKIDTQYVSAQFQHVENVGVCFLCTQDETDQEEDEWIDEKGRHQFIIRLPFDLVKQSPDIREYMVHIIKQRLGEAA